MFQPFLPSRICGYPPTARDQAHLQGRARKQARALLRLQLKLSSCNQQDIRIPNFGQPKPPPGSSSKASSLCVSSVSPSALLPVSSGPFGVEEHFGMQSNSVALQPAVAVTEEAAAETSVAQATPAQDELSRISKTTQTSSNLPIYNHLVPTHNSTPVESTTLYPYQRHPLGFIATLELSKAIP